MSTWVLNNCCKGKFCKTFRNEKWAIIILFHEFLKHFLEMMGFLGMGNNPMVGATVAVAVAVAESLKK